MSMKGKLGLLMAMAALSGSFTQSEMHEYKSYISHDNDMPRRKRTYNKVPPLGIGRQKKRRKRMRQNMSNYKCKKFKR